MTSSTTHYYRTGGTCATGWRTTIDLSTHASGVVTGSGEASLSSGQRCPFPTTQPQIKRYDFKVTGSERSGGLSLTLRGSRPADTTGVEYGGFELTLVAHPRTVVVPIRGKAGSQRFVVRYSGVAGEDRSESRNTIRLTRVNG